MRTRSLMGLVGVAALALGSGVRGEDPAGLILTRGLVPEGFGVNIHFTDPQPGEMERFAEAGFGLARMDFAWGRVERERGQYDFSAYDRLTAHLKQAGVRPLYILDYGNRLYDEGQAPRTEEGREAFARFAAAASSHFRGQGVLWEIWNEPNLDGFWKPKSNAADYGLLAVKTAKAIRGADPQAVILAPGTSGFPWSFFEAVFEAGLLDLVDGVSVHPYRGTAPETAVADYARLRAMIGRYVGPEREALPIVSSEWGYTTAEPYGHLMVPEDQQARYLAREWLSNLAAGVNVSIFYDWKDDGPNPQEREHRFGTVRQDLTPKPAFEAARELIGTLRGYSFRHRLAGEGERDWRLLFQKGDSDELAVAEWSTDPDASRERQTPTIRLLGASDSGWEGLSRLASLRWRAGALVESRARPARLQVRERGDGKPKRGIQFLVKEQSEALAQVATIEDEHTVKRVVRLPVGQASRELREVELVILWEGRPLPELAPLTIVRSDPIRISLVPRENGLVVVLEDPAKKLARGSVSSGSLAQRLRFSSDGQPRSHVTLPPVEDGPAQVQVWDQNGEFVAETPSVRFQTLQLPAERIKAVLHRDNKGTEPEDLPRVEVKAEEAPARYALEVSYHFEPGWRYLTLPVTGDALIPEEARCLWIWVKGDGSENHLRARVRDASGQVFQINLGMLDWNDWRPVRIPLEDLADASHWGGADDGMRHLPLKWESLLLIDSAHKERDQRGEVLLSAPYYEMPAERR